VTGTHQAGPDHNGQKALFIMADSETTTPINLFVAFWHDDKIEASAITADPDAALVAAQEILASRPALYEGDALMVTSLKPPPLTQRGLA
jgi:hypothetical protein